MHRELVEERKWIDEGRYLNALNFCMLLPGPEAMQLATYVGWRLHGLKGGLAAGLLFVIPGALVVLALSMLYAAFGKLPAGRGGVHRHQGGRARHRGRGAAAHRQALAQGQRGVGDRRRCVRRDLLPCRAFPADRSCGRAHRLRARRRRGRGVTHRETGRSRARRADAHDDGSLARHLDRAAGGPGRDVRPIARAVPDRAVLLQARGGDVRRRLCGARLHGAGRRGDASLADRRRDARRTWASPRPRRGR